MVPLTETCILCLITSTGTTIKHEVTSAIEADSASTSTGFLINLEKIDDFPVSYAKKNTAAPGAEPAATGPIPDQSLENPPDLRKPTSD